MSKLRIVNVFCPYPIQLLLTEHVADDIMRLFMNSSHGIYKGVTFDNFEFCFNWSSVTGVSAAPRMAQGEYEALKAQAAGAQQQRRGYGSGLN